MTPEFPGPLPLQPSVILALITTGPLDEEDEVATLEGATLDGAALEAGTLEAGELEAGALELIAEEDFGGFLSSLSLPPQPTSSVDSTTTEETYLVIFKLLKRFREGVTRLLLVNYDLG